VNVIGAFRRAGILSSVCPASGELVVSIDPDRADKVRTWAFSKKRISAEVGAFE
jgi:hypothetical protein